MPEPVTVAVATEATPALLAAFDRLIPQLSKSSPAPTLDELREMIDAECTDVLVATAGAQIVGLLTLVTFRIPTGVRSWIHDVVVDDAARGHGAGAALNRAALALAEQKGSPTVELTSRPSREAANRLYQRLGFEARDTNVYRYRFAAGDAGGEAH